MGKCEWGVVENKTSVLKENLKNYILINIFYSVYHVAYSCFAVVLENK